MRLLSAAGRLRRAPVACVPGQRSRARAGCSGLALDPEFARNRLVYLYFTTADRHAARALALRRAPARARGDRSSTASAPGRSTTPAGSRSGPDRRLYVATGDAGKPELAPRTRARSTASCSRSRRVSTAAAGLYARRSSPAACATPRASTGSPARGALIANEHGPSGFDGPEGYDEVDEIVPGRQLRLAGRRRHAARPVRRARCASMRGDRPLRRDVRHAPRLALDRRLPASPRCAVSSCAGSRSAAATSSPTSRCSPAASGGCAP